MRAPLTCLVAALLLAPLAAAQTEPPCATGAPGCATPPTGPVGTGQEVPASEDPAGGGQGPGIQELQPYDVSPYLPWLVLSIVLVGGLVAALGYTLRRAEPHGGHRRRD